MDIAGIDLGHHIVEGDSLVKVDRILMVVVGILEVDRSLKVDILAKVVHNLVVAVVDIQVGVDRIPKAVVGILKVVHIQLVVVHIPLEVIHIEAGHNPLVVDHIQLVVNHIPFMANQIMAGHNVLAKHKPYQKDLLHHKMVDKQRVIMLQHRSWAVEL